MKPGCLIRYTASLLMAGGLLASSLANAQAREALTRGELLYTTHCLECHTTQMHWRGKKLVADWDSLKQQVRLWQDTAKLEWSDADITSVALYLNKLHYGYPVDLAGRALPPSSSQAAANR
jgi:mono/diheme cytochrome c family protein